MVNGKKKQYDGHIWYSIVKNEEFNFSRLDMRDLLLYDFFLTPGGHQRLPEYRKYSFYINLCFGSDHGVSYKMMLFMI